MQQPEPSFRDNPAGLVGLAEAEEIKAKAFLASKGFEVPQNNSLALAMTKAVIAYNTVFSLRRFHDSVSVKEASYALLDIIQEILELDKKLVND